LLDEPFGALDVKIRAQLRNSLKEIQRQLKVTMVLVTHDQEEAFELADRIGVVDYGHLLEVGSSEELYHRPQKEFTATFIGGGNVLIGRKEKNQIKLGDTYLPLPEHAPLHDENVPMRVLFRPEMVTLQEEPFNADQKVHPLGKGTIKEIIFSGSYQRIFLEVVELHGVQPLFSQQVYGQNSTQITALKPSTIHLKDQYKPGQTLYIGLKDYHILHPSGLKILVYADDSPSGMATVEFGLQLGTATGGSVTLLAITGMVSNMSDVRERLEKLGQDARPNLVNISAKVRMGDVNEEIINERFQEDYEVCVINKDLDSSKSTTTPVWKQLVTFEIPVLLVQNPPNKIQHILICTAAGEPGKADILFGARVAKLTSAKITMFHITNKNATAGEKERVERHLQLGKASLTAMGITNFIKIVENPSPVDGIISELESGNYDLLVIGAPAPTSAQSFFWPNLTSQIINRSTKPVLVVPMLHD
jgi:nucleotide-binding universal stress UspA family protein